MPLDPSANDQQQATHVVTTGQQKPLVIYHGNCADGFTAAWAAWRAFGDGADYRHAIYGEAPPDVRGRGVYLLDFSYKRAALERMIDDALWLVVIDHHKTAEQDLTFLPRVNDAAEIGYRIDGPHGDVRDGHAFARFDMDKSGAGLAWEWFHPGKPEPMLVSIVQDRDLWRFKYPFTREVQAVIFSYPYDFATWDALADRCSTESGIAELRAEGAAIERKHFKDVRELIAAFKRRMVIGGVEVWAANLPYTLTSDAGNMMAEGEPFAACYWDTPDGRVFSLRSTPEGADVSEIAKRYGGGGHKNASGFRLPHGVNP